MSSFARAIGCAVFTCCTFAAVAGGATSVCHDGYSIRTWQTEDGLPQSTVTAITQTQDGFLWIGTLGGLARFDGERFQVFDTANTPALSENRISCLYQDAAGTIWIGHDSGQITCYREGRFEPPPDGARARERIHAIVADAAGGLWLLLQSGVLEPLDKCGLAPPPESAGRERLITAVADGAGGVALLDDGIVRRLHGENLEPINFGSATWTGYVIGLGAAVDGSLWVARDERLRKWQDGRWTEDRGPYPWRECSITHIEEWHNGVLAIGTLQNGLYLIRPDGRALNFDHSNGLSQNWVRTLFEDREGNLWLGVGSGGLVAVRATGFDVLNAPDGWEGRSVLSVAPAPDGSLWIGTEGAGLYRYHEKRWAHFGQDRGFASPFVWSVAADPDGRIWAGTWGGGVYRAAEDGFVEATELGPIGAPILAIQFAATDHALWLGTGLGLLHWRQGTATWRERRESGLPVHVRAIAQDAQGVMWFGLSEGGLGRLADGEYTHFGKADGLSSGSVQCLLADGDTLWVGTEDAGLNRLKDGHVVAFGMDQGLPSNVICHIADDGRGFLWLSTHHGIWRIDRQQLNRCGDGEIATVPMQVYDKSDGLPTLEYSGGMQAAGCRTTDGCLWFTSGKGLVSVDPAAIRTNPLPPPVVIESLHVDGRALGRENLLGGGFRLPPDHHRLEFEFTALCLTSSNKVRFKYRLIGLDRDLIDAGTKRMASYSQLPPGSYRFHVIACNNDGVWNDAGVTLGFSVLPFYWQTWWFRGLASMIVLTSVALGVRAQTRRRMQRRVEQLEYEKGIERERARIAQDIHDDIGSSLTSITMLSQSLRTGLDQPQRAAAALKRIHGTALDVTNALDEIVWAVNPRHDTLESLVSYMAKFAQDMLAAASIRCRFNLPVVLPPWPLNTHARHHLILAFKEALNNAIKHAGATEVRVSLALQPKAFVIVVQDNGRGFVAAPGMAPPVDGGVRGNGLSNMQRRLAQIGGSCTIDTQPGQGARISFTVALHAGNSARA